MGKKQMEVGTDKAARLLGKEEGKKKQVEVVPLWVTMARALAVGMMIVGFMAFYGYAYPWGLRILFLGIGFGAITRESVYLGFKVWILEKKEITGAAKANVIVSIWAFLLAVVMATFMWG